LRIFAELIDPKTQVSTSDFNFFEFSWENSKVAFLTNSATERDVWVQAIRTTKADLMRDANQLNSRSSISMLMPPVQYLEQEEALSRRSRNPSNAAAYGAFPSASSYSYHK
jgi:hypothetical protein